VYINNPATINFITILHFTQLKIDFHGKNGKNRNHMVVCLNDTSQSTAHFSTILIPPGIKKARKSTVICAYTVPAHQLFRLQILLLSGTQSLNLLLTIAPFDSIHPLSFYVIPAFSLLSNFSSQEAIFCFS
jgi:hypothetical protein